MLFGFFLSRFFETTLDNDLMPIPKPYEPRTPADLATLSKKHGVTEDDSDGESDYNSDRESDDGSDDD